MPIQMGQGFDHTIMSSIFLSFFFTTYTPIDATVYIYIFIIQWICMVENSETYSLILPLGVRQEINQINSNHLECLEGTVLRNDCIKQCSDQAITFSAKLQF